MSSSLNALKDEFVRLHGYYSEDIERALQADPVFFEACLNLSFPPGRTPVLDARTRHLVLIAANAAVTYLNESELAQQMRCALDQGATREQIKEVLQMVSVLGIHSFMLGAPILMRELGGAEARRSSEEAKASAEAIKVKFMAGRQYWSELLEDMVYTMPEFFDAYADFSSIPWRNGTLEPKVREFIYIAIDTSTTHLHAEGTRIHMANALRHGATLDEVAEVVQIVSCLGTQSWITGVRLLEQITQ
ncbi:4-carboxymuconolactone decarboxylase [compost metagenome]